jgi:hypothetical protein
MPETSVWVFGLFTIPIAGWLTAGTTGGGGGGVGTVTVTGAESFAVTVPPEGVVPTTVATFVKLAVTFERVQLYVTLAPGAIEASAASAALVFEQSDASGSVTVTFVSVTFPVFVTTIVKFAAAPDAIDCDFGFFVIEIAGLLAGGGGGGPVTPSCSEVHALVTAALSGSPL